MASILNFGLAVNTPRPHGC